jgi:RNA binding exosome subunit
MYLNNILVYSNIEEKHKLYVKEVLQRLQEAKLYLKLSKCKFYTQETKYLGYIVCLEGVKINPLRIKII